MTLLGCWFSSCSLFKCFLCIFPYIYSSLNSFLKFYSILYTFRAIHSIIRAHVEHVFWQYVPQNLNYTFLNALLCIYHRFYCSALQNIIRKWKSLCQLTKEEIELMFSCLLVITNLHNWGKSLICWCFTDMGAEELCVYFIKSESSWSLELETLMRQIQSWRGRFRVGNDKMYF